MKTDAKMSDVFEALALVDSHSYLCNALTSLVRLPDVLKEFDFYLRSHTAVFLGQWLRMEHGSNCLINLYRRYAIEDGVLKSGEEGDAWPLMEIAYYAEVRPKFCRDMAAFLREFGL